jgi:hypothetical protein
MNLKDIIVIEFLGKVENRLLLRVLPSGKLINVLCNYECANDNCQLSKLSLPSQTKLSFSFFALVSFHKRFGFIRDTFKYSLVVP